MPKYWAYFYWVAVFLSVCSRPSGRAKWTPRSTHKHRHAHTHSRDTQTAAACYGKSNESSLSFSHRSVMWPTNVRWFPSTSLIAETAWIFLLLSTGERMSAIGPVVLASRLLLAPLQQPLGIDLVAFVWFLKFHFGIGLDWLQPCYKKINSTIRFSSTRRIEWYKNKVVVVKFKL